MLCGSVGSAAGDQQIKERETRDIVTTMVHSLAPLTQRQCCCVGCGVLCVWCMHSLKIYKRGVNLRIKVLFTSFNHISELLSVFIFAKLRLILLFGCFFNTSGWAPKISVTLVTSPPHHTRYDGCIWRQVHSGWGACSATGSG